MHPDSLIASLCERELELPSEKEPHFVRLLYTVENRVVLCAQRGEVDVDYLADYANLGRVSRITLPEPFSTMSTATASTA